VAGAARHVKCRSVHGGGGEGVQLPLSSNA
jgi:hypothetical protein